MKMHRIEQNSDELREIELQVIRYDSAVRGMLMMPPGRQPDFDQVYRETGVRFQGDCFVIAEFEDDPQAPPVPPADEHAISPTVRYKQLRDMVLEVFSGEHRAVVCNRNGRLLCLVNWQGSGHNWHGEFSLLVNQLNEKLFQRIGFRFQCVVSRMFHGMNQLHRARKELEEAEDYRSIMGGMPGEVIFYDGLLRTVNIEDHEHVLMEEQEQSRALQQALLRGDAAQAGALFHQIMEHNFVNSRPAVRFVQLRIFSVIDSFLRALNQAGEELGLQEEMGKLDAAPRLLDAGNILDLEKAAQSLLADYQQIYDDSQRDSSLAYRIRSYVQQAYGDPNLNVNLVAESFHVTPTYATRIFKQTFAQGILNYIQQVRIDEAKNLLDGTRTVKTVAEQVGFGSSATLIRIFKKIEGITPAQYNAGITGEEKGEQS